MRIIKTLSDIQELKLASAFPLPFIGYIEEQWLGLFEEQREEQDTMHSFSLDPTATSSFWNLWTMATRL